jgi:hypothetical protein
MKKIVELVSNVREVYGKSMDNYGNAILKTKVK